MTTNRNMAPMSKDAQEKLPWLQGIVDQGPKPLFATISGAHLYGFESKDSDYDLRGAFVAHLERPAESRRTVWCSQWNLEMGDLHPSDHSSSRRSSHKVCPRKRR